MRKVFNWLTEKIILPIFRKFKILKGKRVAKKYIVGKTYYNRMKGCYGIYRGNNTFYETKYVTDKMYGVVFFDSKDIKYTDLQIGLFKNLWTLSDCNIITNF